MVKFKNKILDAEATSEMYKGIKKTAYHLTNNTSDAPSEKEERKKLYWQLYNTLRDSVITYDSKKKLATRISNNDSNFDKWQKAKRIPKVLLKNEPKKSKAKRV